MSGKKLGGTKFINSNPDVNQRVAMAQLLNKLNSGWWGLFTTDANGQIVMDFAAEDYRFDENSDLVIIGMPFSTSPYTVELDSTTTANGVYATATLQVYQPPDVTVSQPTLVESDLVQGANASTEIPVANILTTDTLTAMLFFADNGSSRLTSITKCASPEISSNGNIRTTTDTSANDGKILVFWHNTPATQAVQTTDAGADISVLVMLAEVGEDA